MDSPHDSDRLFQLRKIAEIRVKVEANKTLNYSKGVVKRRELRQVTERDMESIPHVTDAHQIYKTIDGKPTKTNTWILTFDTPKCPTKIDVDFLKNIPVSPYIPKPMRCQNCQRLGHTKKRCKAKARCKQCGDAPHGDTCDKEAFCPNCKLSGHTALSTDCPQYTKIQQILKYQAETSTFCSVIVRLNISYYKGC